MLRPAAALLFLALALAACDNDDGVEFSSPPPSLTNLTLPNLDFLTIPAEVTVEPGPDEDQDRDQAEATTTMETTTVETTVAPVANDWESATANLAGLPTECGNLAYVTTRPDRDVVITSVALAGLHASVDGSETWTQLGQGEGSAAITNRASSIVFDPDHPDTFWESGSYDGAHVLRTDDGGLTFQQLGDVLFSDLVSVDLTDPGRQTLLSGTHEQPIVERSSDGGLTWSDVSASLPSDIGFASSPHVIDAQTHLLGTKNGAGAGIFRTVDGGVTWTLVAPGGVVGAPLVVDDSISWLRENGGGLVTSTDDGVTWTEIPANGRIGTDQMSLIGLSGGRIATIGATHVVVSDDGGVSWTPIGSPLPYQPNGLAYSASRDTMYVWRFTCDFETDDVVPADAIMSMADALDE